MNSEELFRRTFADLKIKVASNDEYELLRAAGLIRQLIIDGDVSLANTVKKPYGIKLRFRYVDATQGYSGAILALNPMTWTIQDGIDPETMLTNGHVTEGSLDDFLSAPVLVKEGSHFSVKDNVTYVANVMGGVHAGKAKTPEHESMTKIAYRFDDIPSAVNQIKSIGRVVVSGLSPISDAMAL